MTLARRDTRMRSSALLLLALGLTLRALIPAGYMPSADAAGAAFVPCTGIASGQAIELGTSSNADASDAQQARCPFGLLTLGASDLAVATPMLAVTRIPLRVRAARITPPAPQSLRTVHGARSATP
jgi:hypothetical protein